MNVIYAPLVVMLALFSVWLLDRRWPVSLGNDRVASIDGLRGYLAVGVFIHHACIWYFYLRSNVWQKPPSLFYEELGHSSVGLFFMITGYLFTDRLLRARRQPINWDRLYTSRLLRVMPLFFLHNALALLALGVFELADLPTVFGGIAIDRKILLTAGVSWTLTYEWRFYLLLPLLALLWHARPPRVLILLSAAMLFDQRDAIFSLVMLPFAGGIVAAFVASSGTGQRFSRSPLASLLVAVALLAAYSLGLSFGIAFWLALLTLAFSLIACGNDIFGLLSWRPSRVLGEITYSLYLLHGIVLYSLFCVLLGVPVASGLAREMHWLAVVLVTPVLVAVSFLSWSRIEMPFMRCVDQWAGRLRFSFPASPPSIASSPPAAISRRPS